MAARKTDVISAVCDFFTPIAELVSGKTVCVCLSGGADSVALLRAMLELRGTFGFTVNAVHFNHMIRGEESDRDESFCRELCKKLEVELLRGRDDVPAYAARYKKSLEEAARDCRYAYFNRMLAAHRFDFYATAHNMNDDAETLLLNLIRGSGANGASSLAPVNGALLRPLLKVDRSEIESYLLLLGQDHVEDSTNSDLNYSRNYIRRVLIPAMEKLNPSVIGALSDYASSVRTDRDYFETVAVCERNTDLRNVHRAVAVREILRNYKAYSGKILNKEQINSILNALNGPRAVIGVDGDTEAVAENGTVTFIDRSGPVPVYPDVPLKNGVNELFGGRVSVYLGDPPDKDTNFNNLAIRRFISFDNICGELRVRQRKTGDRLTSFGVNRSVKKLFIDKKIPKEYRDLIPVFYDDLGIVYIPFAGIADRVFSQDQSKAVSITCVFETIVKERWRQAYEK